LSLESQAYDKGAGATPYHGELVIAIDPQVFMGPSADLHSQRAEKLFEAIVDQGARLPSQRRYEARARSEASGTVTIPESLHKDILALLD
jgi:LDH2 family malate/lactate/ureidoglycolate dehydrogenase